MYKDVFSDAEIVQRRALWRVLVRHFFQKYVKPEETVLDIGSGWGEFINQIEARRRVAIDVSDEYRRYHGPGLLYSLQSCCNLAFKDGAADVVFASNVFEHLASRDDLMAALKEIRRVLRPGGRLLILQPNFKYCYREYFDIFDHYQAYTHVSMREILQLSGFTIRELHARFLPFSTKQRLPQAGWLVKLYLAMPIWWRVFGKQMFIVAERP
jgi:ubiquinone/menaquinone biosynthesis C-methylase UbiE